MIISGSSVSQSTGTYTPTWASSGTQPTGGTHIGTWTKTGNLCTLTIAGSMSGATFGTGNYTFSIPFTAAAQNYEGASKAFDSGTAIISGISEIAASGSTVTCYSGSAPNQWGQTLPMTWTTSDSYVITITYRTV